MCSGGTLHVASTTLPDHVEPTQCSTGVSMQSPSEFHVTRGELGVVHFSMQMFIFSHTVSSCTGCGLEWL